MHLPTTREEFTQFALEHAHKTKRHEYEFVLEFVQHNLDTESSSLSDCIEKRTRMAFAWIAKTINSFPEITSIEPIIEDIRDIKFAGVRVVRIHMQRSFAHDVFKAVEEFESVSRNS